MVVLGPDELAQNCIKMRNMTSHSEYTIPLDKAAKALNGFLMQGVSDSEISTMLKSINGGANPQA